MLERTLLDFVTRPSSDSDWTTLLAAARNRTPPAALLSVDSPAFANPPSMRAAIDAQLGKRCLSPPRDLAGYTRLICDSLGRSHADAVRRFERLARRRFKRILIVGGGSKNSLLCQATANAAKLPVVSFEIEGSAAGNLANQLIALGAVRDLPTFRRNLGRQLKQKVYQPLPSQ